MSRQKKNSISFSVADVEVDKTLLKTITQAQVFEHKLASKIEATSCKGDDYVDTYYDFTHHFLSMLSKAFTHHKPIAFGPDHLWLLICQGFAEHIRLDPKKWSTDLIDFEGKTTIEIEKNDFLKGNPNNPWEDVFSELTKATDAYLKEDLKEILILDFSTTGPKEKAAYEIAFLDAMSAYFVYEVYTLCGIPEITLEGVKDDYLKIKTQMQKLKRFDLEWWIEPLDEILDKIIASFDGEIDTVFWNSIFKQNNMSGGPHVNGWILKFFPYIKKTVREMSGKMNLTIGYRQEDVVQIIKRQEISPNEFITKLLLKNIIVWQNEQDYTASDFPVGMSKAPFKWIFPLKSYDMYFFAGFLGVKEDPETNCLYCEINWAIAEFSEQLSVNSEQSG